MSARAPDRARKQAEDSLRLRVVDLWSEKLWIDYTLACFLLTLHLVVIRETRHGDWLRSLDPSQRQGIYTTAATIISAIGGLSAIAFTVYMSATGERAVAVKKLYHGTLRRNWRGLLAATGLTATLCLIAQTLDVSGDPYSARFIFEFAFILAAIRFGRLLWLFDKMMQVSDMDTEETLALPMPEFDPNWAEHKAE